MKEKLESNYFLFLLVIAVLLNISALATDDFLNVENLYNNLGFSNISLSLGINQLDSNIDFPGQKKDVNTNNYSCTKPPDDAIGSSCIKDNSSNCKSAKSVQNFLYAIDVFILISMYFIIVKKFNNLFTILSNIVLILIFISLNGVIIGYFESLQSCQNPFTANISEASTTNFSNITYLSKSYYLLIISVVAAILTLFKFFYDLSKINLSTKN